MIIIPISDSDELRVNEGREKVVMRIFVKYTISNNRAQEKYVPLMMKLQQKLNAQTKDNIKSLSNRKLKIVFELEKHKLVLKRCFVYKQNIYN